jgi:hypothetical protein
MSELDGRVIRAIDVGAPTFKKTFEAIKDQNLRPEILATIRSMMFQNIDRAPRKWHMHQLTGKLVPSFVDPSKKVAVWTLHVTADDSYKASFTLEDCKACFRLVDEHDIIDKRP